MAIHTRFNLIWNLSEKHGVKILSAALIQVPDVGQIVSLDGNPYRVIRVGWAVGEESDTYVQYAYVEVQKASNFRVKLGGRTY